VWRGCQLINARQTPASFIAIHLPPLGSRGKTARHVAKSITDGGRAIDRVRSSSRFIARQNPYALGRNETVHINQPTGTITQRSNIVANSARAPSRKKAHGGSPGSRWPMAKTSLHCRTACGWGPSARFASLGMTSPVVQWTSFTRRVRAILLCSDALRAMLNRYQASSLLPDRRNALCRCRAFNFF